MISLHYTATLNGNTQIGIENPDTNAVKLEYSNNPNTTDKGFTHEVDVDIYTFGLEINKVDARNANKTLAGAEFILYRTISEVTTYAQAAEQEDGSYKINAWVSGEENATRFVTGDNGKLLVCGVKAGAFYVKETKAPSGYNPLEEPLEVWIQVQSDKLNNTDKLDDVTASVGNARVEVDPASGIVSATIENASGTVLPSTGGIGTTIFYVAGSILVVAALILLVTKKRMDAEA
jgi:LPXTG-motif cell wall-anchored protein